MDQKNVRIEKIVGFFFFILYLPYFTSSVHLHTWVFWIVWIIWIKARALVGRYALSVVVEEFTVRAGTTGHAFVLVAVHLPLHLVPAGATDWAAFLKHLTTCAAEALTTWNEGKTLLNDVARIVGIDSERFEHIKGDSESLGGLILERVGRMPKKDRELLLEDFRLKVLETSQRRIERVLITLLNPTEE